MTSVEPVRLARSGIEVTLPPLDADHASWSEEFLEGSSRRRRPSPIGRHAVVVGV